eukprot:gene10112-biopygen6255
MRWKGNTQLPGGVEKQGKAQSRPRGVHKQANTCRVTHRGPPTEAGLAPLPEEGAAEGSGEEKGGEGAAGTIQGLLGMVIVCVPCARQAPADVSPSGDAAHGGGGFHRRPAATSSRQTLLFCHVFVKRGVPESVI